MNIILVSRSKSKLETVAEEIRETFNVQTDIIDVDFTHGLEIFDKIRGKVEKRQIGVLVNNVGFCYSCPDYFLSIPDREKFINDMIRCNVTSMPMMCSIVLPKMLAKKCGIIINISSISATMPACNLSIYSASKAFAHKFSVDLAAEYKDDGIIIQSIFPGFVATKMTRMKSWLLAPSPQKFVESALSTVGFTDATTGYLPHFSLIFASQLLNFIMPSVPRFITLKVLEFVRKHEIKNGRYASAVN